MSIPDAPWIRDAELNGMPEGRDYACPVCGRKCDTIYTDDADDVVGCDWCIHSEDAVDWYDRMREEGEL